MKQVVEGRSVACVADTAVLDFYLGEDRFVELGSGAGGAEPVGVADLGCQAGGDGQDFLPFGGGCVQTFELFGDVAGFPGDAGLFSLRVGSSIASA